LRAQNSERIVERFFSYQPSNNLYAERLVELFKQILEAEVSDELNFHTFSSQDVINLIKYFGGVTNNDFTSKTRRNPLLNAYYTTLAIEKLIKHPPDKRWESYF
jgi:hypothetical protein